MKPRVGRQLWGPGCRSCLCRMAPVLVFSESNGVGKGRRPARRSRALEGCGWSRTEPRGCRAQATFGRWGETGSQGHGKGMETPRQTSQVWEVKRPGLCKRACPCAQAGTSGSDLTPPSLRPISMSCKLHLRRIPLESRVLSGSRNQHGPSPRSLSRPLCAD